MMQTKEPLIVSYDPTKVSVAKFKKNVDQDKGQEIKVKGLKPAKLKHFRWTANNEIAVWPKEAKLQDVCFIELTPQQTELRRVR